MAIAGAWGVGFGEKGNQPHSTRYNGLGERCRDRREGSGAQPRSLEGFLGF